MHRFLTLVLFAATVLCSCTRLHSTGGKRNSWTIPGVLRIAQREDPDNLNLLLGTETVDIDISAFWGAYLFRWSDRNELVPELATVEPTHANGGISRDGLRIAYRLRSDVKWQDGAPFTADDVIYTWQQMLNPRNMIVSRVGYDVISSIDRVDAHSIVVHLKRPFAPFVNTFFAPANHPDVILPKHLLAGYSDINHIAYNATADRNRAFSHRRLRSQLPRRDGRQQRILARAAASSAHRLSHRGKRRDDAGATQFARHRLLLPSPRVARTGAARDSRYAHRHDPDRSFHRRWSQRVGSRSERRTRAPRARLCDR